MKMIKSCQSHSKGNFLFWSAILFLFILPACHKGDHDPHVINHPVKLKRDFNQVNLVSNSAAYMATRLDPTLLNAWGLAFSAGGTAWPASHEGHVSQVITSEGVEV